MIDYDVPKAVQDWLNPNLGKLSFEMPFCGDGMKTKEEFLATTKAIRDWCAENKYLFSVTFPDSFTFEGKEVTNPSLTKCLMKFEKIK